MQSGPGAVSVTVDPRSRAVDPKVGPSETKTPGSYHLGWANYYWAIITHFKGVWKVFNRT